MYYILKVSRYINIVYIGVYLWKIEFQLSSTFFSFFVSGLQIAQVTF